MATAVGTTGPYPNIDPGLSERHKANVHVSDEHLADEWDMFIACIDKVKGKEEADGNIFGLLDLLAFGNRIGVFVRKSLRRRVPPNLPDRLLMECRSAAWVLKGVRYHTKRKTRSKRVPDINTVL